MCRSWRPTVRRRCLRSRRRPPPNMSLGVTQGNSFGPASLNGNGTWNLFDQVTGFSGQYTAYKISIDNALFAQALVPLANSQGDAYIAKKDFSILLTTDGSGAPN